MTRLDLHSDLEHLALSLATHFAHHVEDLIRCDTVSRATAAERLATLSSWDDIAQELALLARARAALGDRLQLPELVALALERHESATD